MKRISVVTPCYNEAENIRPFRDAIADVFATLPYELEFVFVNDGSADDTQKNLLALAAEDPRVKYVEFARNFGQQAATSAGLTHSSGDAVMMMDVDLQHPPALIPEFIRRWEGGSDAVFGLRKTRKDRKWYRGMTSKAAAIVINLGEHSSLPYNASDFSIMDRSVIEAFKKLPPRAVMTRFRIAQASKKHAFVSFDVATRGAGESKYTLSKLVALLWKSTFGKSVGVRYEIKGTNTV